MSLGGLDAGNAAVVVVAQLAFADEIAACLWKGCADYVAGLAQLGIWDLLWSQILVAENRFESLMFQTE